jgi:hypothetical protein
MDTGQKCFWQCAESFLLLLGHGTYLEDAVVSAAETVLSDFPKDARPAER